MDNPEADLKRALKSVANILSQRPHSVAELKKKLSSKYQEDLVQKVLKISQENNWLESEDTLSEQVVASLHNKNKSWAYIKNYLRQKQLPLTTYDKEKELEKVHRALLKKFGEAGLNDLKNQKKAKQFLFYRGFQMDIIREALSELDS